jgi:hypothetical protein
VGWFKKEVGRVHTEATEKAKATEDHGEGNFYALRAKRIESLPPWSSVALAFSVSSV